MRLTRSGQAHAVCPGTKNVAGASCLASSLSTRSSPIVPNSPREIMLGLFDWNEPIQIDIPSKSKVRQTEWVLSPMVISLVVFLRVAAARRER